MGDRRDVIVVGAGPAGTAAARVLAAAGLDVVVVERKRVVGEPNHCGEALSVECLREAGVEAPQPWIRRRVPGAQVVFPNGCRLRFPREGYCVDRPSFDRFLSDRARAAGAKILTSVRVRGLTPCDEGWTLRTSGGELEARYLIGAGGPRCPVATKVAGPMPTVGAIQYKFRNEDCPRSQRDEWLRFHFDEAFPGGYAWVFDRGDEVSVGVTASGPVKDQLDVFCRRLGIDPGWRLETAGGPIPCLAQPSCLEGYRVLLCGDAGGFTYPLTKGGIYGALWSGRLAGEAVIDALHQGDPRSLGRYPRRVRQHPCRSRRELSASHATLALDNPVLDTIGSIMDGRTHTDMPVGRCLEQLRRGPFRLTASAIAAAFVSQRSYLRSEHFAW